MILIVTTKRDYTADFLINKLNNRKASYLRFNCEDALSYETKIDSNLNVTIDGHYNFSSIWFRRTASPQVHEFIRQEIDSFLKNLWSLIPGRWLSHPDDISKAENKLFQLRKSLEIGFQIPNTIVSNHTQELKNFYLENERDLIIKPISFGRYLEDGNLKHIFTNPIRHEHMSSPDDYNPFPSIVQRNIKKEYEIRVTVVNEAVFAAKVDSQSNADTKYDWRRKKLKFECYDLPESISSKCISLVKRLNLKFGAIDLIKDKSGQYIFLEINPNGQWAWIEMDTGLLISDAIIKELERNNAEEIK